MKSRLPLILLLLFLPAVAAVVVEDDDPEASSTCVVGPDGVCLDDHHDDPLFGVPQDISESNAAAHERYQQMQQYMAEYYQAADAQHNTIACRNQHAQCLNWALQSECEHNPGYMLLHCAPVCFSCDQLDRNKRCAFDESLPKQWQQPGDLNRFFEGVVQRYQHAKVTIHSAPADRVEALNLGGGTAIYDGPWVLTIDGFLTKEECEHLIEQGESLGYQRSKGQKDGGAEGNPDITTDARTSSNTWCDGTCSEHPNTAPIAQKVRDLTAPIPELHSEHWQLLKYLPGERYTTHNDHILAHLHRAPGVRILTVFVYLNDAVGGGTNFPAIAHNLTVQPVAGRVVLWPSVLNEHPDDVDERTNHQALPAITTKYGANMWFHQRDYKTPYYKGCD